MWEAAYGGWFGPMGAAAVFYALDVLVQYHEGRLQYDGAAAVAQDTWLVVSMVVFASTLVHAITAIPGTLLLKPGFTDKDQQRDEAWDTSSA